MGLSNSKAQTKKALIRWFNPDKSEQKKVYDNTIQSDVPYTKKTSENAKPEIMMATVGGRNANEIIPDVRKSETHKYSSDVTEYAVEDGTILSQHVIQKPAEVNLQFNETNGGKVQGDSSISNSEMFDKLLEIWEKKIPVSIVTEQKEYKNMVITNMPIMHKQPYKGALQIMVDFIELKETKTQTSQYRGSSVSVDKAASQMEEGGQQTVQEIE